jgi:aryl-alcohol dehydrogenase-like predicted oxidoreductase
MNKLLIQNTDISVSPFCLGTMTFGRPVAERDALELVHFALAQGINFFDTADMYEGYDRRAGSAGGVAETILGKALRGRRDQAIITTKVGNAVGDGQYEGSGLSRQHITRQIETSLQRLQTEYVDFYLLHRPDPLTPLAESIETLVKLIDVGKVRHWGFSNFSAEQVKSMITICDTNNWPRPVISQPPYSWLKRDIAEKHLPLCKQFNIAVTPYQPLQGGLLTGKYHADQPLPASTRITDGSGWLVKPDESLWRRLTQFEQEADLHNLTPTQYACDWLLAQEQISSVVVGVKRRQQLAELLRVSK